jgi:hypothetical protein
VAKCSPNESPARINRLKIRFGMALISRHDLEITNGESIKVAILSLPAAITNEGASCCAKRINIDAVETATMPKNNPKRGEILNKAFMFDIRVNSG